MRCFAWLEKSGAYMLVWGEDVIILCLGLPQTYSWTDGRSLCRAVLCGWAAGDTVHWHRKCHAIYMGMWILFSVIKRFPMANIPRISGSIQPVRATCRRAPTRRRSDQVGRDCEAIYLLRICLAGSTMRCEHNDGC